MSPSSLFVNDLIPLEGQNCFIVHSSFVAKTHQKRRQRLIRKYRQNLSFPLSGAVKELDAIAADPHDS